MKTIVHTMFTNHKKITIGIAGVIIIAVLGVSLTNLPASKQKKEAVTKESLTLSTAIENTKSDLFQEKVNDTLAVIDSRLSQVQKEMEKNASQNKDNSASVALNDLSRTIVDFKNRAENSLQKSHEENEALSKKITALEEVIASLKGEKKSFQYLDKKALPFDVMAIDSVNEQAVIAIKYNYNHVALEKGEVLGGWKVINLDYAKQTVEFDDEKGAHVVLSLKENHAGEKTWG